MLIESNLAGFYADQGQIPLAIFFAKQAVNTLQSIRENLGAAAQSTQQAFLADNEDHYRLLAGLLIIEGRLPEAQQVLRMLKEKEYFAFIRRDASADPRQTRSALNAVETEQARRLDQPSQTLAPLWDELHALYRINEQVRTPSEQARIAQLERDTDAATEVFYQALDEVYAAFAAQAGSYDRERYAQLDHGLSQAQVDPSGLNQTLQQLSGRRVALVQYLLLPERLHIIVTIGAARRAFEVELGAADLSLAIQAFRDEHEGPLLNPDRDPLPQAQWLYQQLIAPFAAELEAGGVDMLMFSLDGALRYLPMAALHDGEGYLIERYGLAMYTGVRDDQLNQPPAPAWQVAAFGVSEAHRQVGPSRRNFGRLPGVPDELEGIVKRSARDTDGVAPGQVYLDPAFTRGRLNRVLRGGDHSVVHLATHFALEPGDDSSFLLLGDGDTLSLRDIRRRGALRNVDLVTLSACDTAVELSGYAGSEIDGLGLVMQEKGARGVIATLWPVADSSTGLLMRQLYQLREQQGLSKAEALRQAQLSLLYGRKPDADAGTLSSIASTPASGPDHAPRCSTSRGSRLRLIPTGAPPDPACRFNHPYYWAPFILMGNWL